MAMARSGAPLTIPVGNQPVAIVAGDFNDDGKLDLAVANSGDSTSTLLLGNGDGTFTHVSGSPCSVGQGPYAIIAADFKGDGKLDLAVAKIGYRNRLDLAPTVAGVNSVNRR